MIGIIQNVLLDVLTDIGGLELRDRVMKEAGVPEDTVYRLDRNYPDEDCLNLIAATARLTDHDAEEISKLFARKFMVKTREVFPRFYELARDSEEFLRRQAMIHRMIGASLRTEREKAAVRNKFSVEDHGPGKISVTYGSSNMLCDYYRAMARETARSYGDEIDIDTVQCRRRGDAICKFAIQWPSYGWQRAAE